MRGKHVAGAEVGSVLVLEPVSKFDPGALGAPWIVAVNVEVREHGWSKSLTRASRRPGGEGVGYGSHPWTLRRLVRAQGDGVYGCQSVVRCGALRPPRWGCLSSRAGRGRRAAPTSRWKRPGCTGSRYGTWVAGPLTCDS